MRYVATLKRALWVALALIAVLGVSAGEAQAKDKSKGTTSAKATTGAELTSVLDELEWGMSSKDVLKRLDARIWATFEAETADTADIGKKDKVRKQYKQRADKLVESFKELKSASRSGLEVSVVSDEFVLDNNESVVVVREDIATRYYFFVNDKFYKLAIAYDPSYIGDLAFDSFIAAVATKYGKPNTEVTDEEGFFAQAIWESNGSRLRVDDKWHTYDTYLMAFTDINLESSVKAKHEAAIRARYTEPEVGADISALTEGDDDMGRSAADALLGGSTRVDLKAGLPQEDIDAMNAEKIAAAEGGDKSGLSEKKAKAPKKKKDNRKKFEDLEKKDEKKGLIIY